MSYLVKSINWVWNQYNNIYEIHEKINLWKKYNNVIDWFLGWGSLLLNLNASWKKYIWYDKMDLSIKFFNSIQNNQKEIQLKDFWNVINKYNNFSEKENYYDFRNDWNLLYKKSNFSKKDFIIKTILLLKLCSNSIIRFNKKWEFNQGFRWLWKRKLEKWTFFTEKVISKVFLEYEKLIKRLNSKDFSFEIWDFLKEMKKYWEWDLLILDPPYKDIWNVYNSIWNEEKEKELLEFLLNEYKWDFIYFNYLNKERKSEELKKKNLNLVKFMNVYPNIKLLNMKSHISMWQKRKWFWYIKQVILTNIK